MNSRKRKLCEKTDCTQTSAKRNKTKKEEQFLAAIVQNSDDAIIGKDIDGNITSWNNAAEKIYGYKAVEVLGKSITILALEKEKEEISQILKRISAGEQIKNLQTQRLRKDGTTIDVSLTISPIRDHHGTIIGASTIGRDITKNKRMEQELATFLEESRQRESEVSALLKASKAVLQNKEFQVSALAIFGACKELIGATAGYVALLSDDGKENQVLFLDSGGLPCTVDPSLPMPIRGLRSIVYNSGEVAVENDFPHSKWQKFSPKGHVQLKNVLFAPLTIEQRTVGVIGLANKIGGFTKRDAEMSKAFGEIASVALVNSQMLEKLEENEKEVRMHSEQLEKLVEERTKKLQESERLATVGATAGMVGHDIRNPLQAIISDVYLAKTELTSIPESDEKKYVFESLKEIEENADYINKIVQDLQDYARPLNPNAGDADLKLIIDKLLEKNGIIENVKVSVKVEDEAKKIVADSDYLNRILYNLFTNAVQAMPKGGKLAIKVYKEANDTVISVKDTGVGIPEANKSKLFTPMFTTKAKGQGFGLPVVKRMTESLGGTVSFESQEGKGTTFTIRLPIKR